MAGFNQSPRIPQGRDCFADGSPRGMRRRHKRKPRQEFSNRGNMTLGEGHTCITFVRPAHTSQVPIIAAITSILNFLSENNATRIAFILQDSGEPPEEHTWNEGQNQYDQIDWVRMQ